MIIGKFMIDGRVHLNVKNVGTIILIIKNITGAFRNILCDACNVNDKINNTSGYPNISKDGNGWIYKKTIRKVTGSKWFKTKEETIKYKLEIEST